VARLRRFHVLVAVTATVLSSFAVGVGTAGAVVVPPPECVISAATGATGTTAYPAVGAVADDAIDDRAFIQRAIDRASAAGGGVVTLPKGKLLVNAPVKLKRNVSLKGLGAATVVKAGPTFLASFGPFGGHPLITTNGAVNVTIANLTADQSGDTLNGNVRGRLTEYLIDIRWSTNALVTGVTTKNPYTYSIVAASSKRFCIVGNNTSSTTQGKYDQLDGIHILNSSLGDVVRNTVDQGAGGPNGDGDDGLVAHTMNGAVHDVRYVQNKVRGGRHGHGMQFALSATSDQVYNITVTDNEIWGSPAGIITGYYGASGLVRDVAITRNNFHDNARNAVRITGRPSNVKVTMNRNCASGSLTVVAGSGNVVSGTTGC
jgi:polygalacturonase